MISRLLTRLARNHSHTNAWIEPSGERLCWLQVDGRVRETMASLSDAGIQPGNMVVTQLPNSSGAVDVSLALNAISATESPVDSRFGSAFAREAAKRLGAHFIIDAQGICRFDREKPTRPWPTLRRPGLILWTSGTTSGPKAVVLKWGGVLANAKGKLGAAPQSQDDVRLTLLPLSHAYARTCDFATWLLTGGTLAVSEGWNGLSENGPKIRPTLLNTVPYLIDKIFGPVDAATPSVRERLGDLGLDRLRLLGCGGAALTRQRFDQIQQLGITPIQGYGLTESSPVICSATPEDARAGVVGRPIRHTRVRISEQGEVQCQGPGIMQGYWCNEAATLLRFTSDGWFRTGDRGEIEMDGALKILGRLDDVVVLSTGYKFWPIELENRLSSLPGIHHVVVRANGSGLEAIVDAETETCTDKISRLFEEAQRNHPTEPRITRIHKLQRSLSVEAGELTAKNTVRRQEIFARLDASATQE
jgi:long-chain acyl-CoA synthetase